MSLANPQNDLWQDKSTAIQLHNLLPKSENEMKIYKRLIAVNWGRSVSLKGLREIDADFCFTSQNNPRYYNTINNEGINFNIFTNL